MACPDLLILLPWNSDRMKSICILVQNYYEIDIRVRRKAEALVAAGYLVDVFALASSFAKSGNYTLNGVNVFTLRLRKQRSSLARYAFEYLSFWVWCFFKLLARMGKRRYSIVDVNNLPDFLVFAAAYAKWRGSKIIFDMHEITPEFYISKYGIKESSRLVRFLKFIERISFDFADLVITINEPIQQLLETRGLPPAKTAIIMNSVDEGLFASSPLPSSSGLEDEKFIMMYHGTLTHIYGLDIALEAFARVHREMPGAEFWILGNGPEKSSLQHLSRDLGLDDKVKFLGNVLPQEVPQWLGRCHAAVLATRRDIFLDYSFSNKLSEYIIMGKPVISSRLKTIRHYFSEEALAYFEPNDPTALAMQMSRAFRDQPFRTRLAQNAKREYTPINWQVMKGRYLELVDKLTQSQAQSRGSIPSATAAAGSERFDGPCFPLSGAGRREGHTEGLR